MQTDEKRILKAAAYFLLSTIITWYFIQKGDFLYENKDKMLFSCGIAGAKWGIQLAAAYFFLAEKRWVFIEKLGFVCFVGSCILLPFCLFENLRATELGFLWSLFAAVLVMIVLYYRAVRQTGIGQKWFWGWFSCLILAVLLQMVVIFRLFY
jgi:hypothetical protein